MKKYIKKSVTFKKQSLACVLLLALVVCSMFFTSVKSLAATNQIEYDFTKSETVSSVIAYYQPNSTSGTGAREDFGEHWSVENGAVKRINDLGGSDVAGNYAELYFDKKFTNFEINYNVKAPAGTLGWTGIMFGKNNLSASFFTDGDSAFFNTALGNAYFWGQSVGGADLSGNSSATDYKPDVYNKVKIKAYGNDASPYSRTVEFWVNGQKKLTNTKGVKIQEGYVGLFTTTGTAEFTDIGFNYLNSKGQVINYKPVTSVQISNKVSSAIVGDTFDIATVILPENATNKRVKYVSSDLASALITPSGKVFCLNNGSANIKVISIDDQTVFDEFTIDIKPELSSIQINNKITEAKVGDAYTFSANILPSDFAETLVYTSSDNNIATVNDSGEVKFLAPGTVTIKVRGQKYNGIVDSVTIQVTGASQKSGCKNAAIGGGAISSVIIVSLLLLVCTKKRKTV